MLELGIGWRIPTVTEWSNVITAGNWVDWNGPWNSDLKLHAAGFLNSSDGGLNAHGSYGSNWSTTLSTATDGWDIYLNAGVCGLGSNEKAYGFSLRCIKE